jgi:hypothetical protein
VSNPCRLLELLLSEQTKIKELEEVIEQLRKAPKPVLEPVLSVEQRDTGTAPVADAIKTRETIEWTGDLAEDLGSPKDKVAMFYSDESGGPPFQRNFICVSISCFE